MIGDQSAQEEKDAEEKGYQGVRGMVRGKDGHSRGSRRR